jgi:hypothetical protein
LQGEAAVLAGKADKKAAGKPKAETQATAQAPVVSSPPVERNTAGESEMVTFERTWENLCFGPEAWEATDLADDSQCAPVETRVEFILQAMSCGLGVVKALPAAMAKRLDRSQLEAFLTACEGIMIETEPQAVAA